MNIDISTIKPGGRVSVTLTDGTKIIDSPVTVGAANLGEALFIADGCVCLRNALDHLTVRVASVDAYTPPEPEREVSVVDLVAALRASIEAAKARRAEGVRP